MSIFLSHEIPAILWISSFTFILLGIYMIAVWGIFRYEHMALVEPPPSSVPLIASRIADLKKAIGAYSINALIVVGAAVFLPYFGAHIAKCTGLSNSFFATLFIAATTSLPELVVSLAALRIGAIDMAVGNLLGSNVFNMFILGIDDVFYREGSLFKAIAPSHLLSVFVTIIMTAVVGLGLLFKPRKKQLWLLGLDTFIILLLYLALMTYLFIQK